MFSKILNWIKEVISKLINKDVSSQLGVDVVISTDMSQAIELWSNLYKNQAPWLDELDEKGRPLVKSLGLPAAIASEFARIATIEMKSSVEGENARATYLNEIYQQVIEDMRINAEYACAKGGLMIKPYFTNGTIALNYIQADRFYPTSFNDNGKITGAIFVDKLVKGKKFYTRFESHNLHDNQCDILNIAYMSENANDLGRQISLESVDEWASLEPSVTINSIDKPLFAYIKMPFANNVDNTSPLGVSSFARVVNLIEDADRQYSRLLWEFEGGELAVHADITTFTKRELDDILVQPPLSKRLFKSIDVGDNLYQVYSPALRDTSLINGLNSILRKIEFNCGLAYGTLSDSSEADKTATEIKMTKQRTYATIQDIQKALQNGLTDLIETLDVFMDLYMPTIKGTHTMVFEWDDSIVVDTDVEFARRLQLVAGGIMSNAELRAWYLGETIEEAEKNLPKVEIEKTQEME